MGEVCTNDFGEVTRVTVPTLGLVSLRLVSTLHDLSSTVTPRED